MYWKDIRDLKKQYRKQLEKARNAKTKKTQEKYRGLAQETRRKLSNELAEWDFSDLDFKQFNIMAPVGGPYCLVHAKNFKIESNLGSALQVSFETSEAGTRWAGYLHWIEDKCGIDNTKLVS